MVYYITIIKTLLLNVEWITTLKLRVALYNKFETFCVRYCIFPYVFTLIFLLTADGFIPGHSVLQYKIGQYSTIQ
jgi:hypothetical protein